jgi:hypothetical protein
MRNVTLRTPSVRQHQSLYQGQLFEGGGLGGLGQKPGVSPQANAALAPPMINPPAIMSAAIILMRRLMVVLAF